MVRPGVIHADIDPAEAEALRFDEVVDWGFILVNNLSAFFISRTCHLWFSSQHGFEPKIQ
jgi:hypothetical protein